MKRIGWMMAATTWLASGVWAAGAWAADVDCGATITENTVVTGGTITTSTCSAGLTVDGAELDLNGWTLQGDGSDPAGVLLTGRRATVKNGAIKGFGEYGVYAIGEGGHRVEDLYVADNDEEGVYLDSPKNRVENVVSENNAIGFYAGGDADKSRFERCHARNNSEFGFVDASSNGKIEESTAVGNDEGISVFVGSGGKFTLKENISHGNTSTGIVVSGSGKLTFKDNIISYNDGDGFVSSGGTIINARGNRAIGNSLDGFEFGGSIEAKLQGNEAIGNGGAGFYANLPTKLQLKDNLALDNAGTGNFCSGFCMTGSGITLQANVAVGGDDDGFSIFDGGAATLKKNESYAAGGDGIFLGDASVTEVTGSVVIGATDNGIAGESGSVAEIDKSIAIASNQSGGSAVDLSDVDGCANITWSKNYLGNNEEADAGITVSDACID